MTSTVKNRGRISGIRLRAASTALASLLALVATPWAQAQTYRVLYNFSGGTSDGEEPYSGVVRDAKGNSYGTTALGGANGFGTVFKLSATGKETVLYSFRGGTDGAYPYAGLVRDKLGNLYGTTTGGGQADNGTVFKLVLGSNGKWTETVLHRFAGYSTGDGSVPTAALILHAGNLYGTTNKGGIPKSGPPNNGTVYKLSPGSNGKWTETVLYSFSLEGGDGFNPYAGLVLDGAGNLYGTTTDGGSDDSGTVFKLDTAGLETVLHSFAGTGGDGATPYAGLVFDAAGNLYGTTSAGGGASGLGTVFKIDTNGTETVLHEFTGGDGASPYAGLIFDAGGNLYGTTTSGGASNDGTVFKLAPGSNSIWTESVLHSFAGNPKDDGGSPFAGLFRDAMGNLYGTTEAGGKYGCCKGVVFQIQSTRSPTVP